MYFSVKKWFWNTSLHLWIRCCTHVGWVVTLELQYLLWLCLTSVSPSWFCICVTLKGSEFESLISRMSFSFMIITFWNWSVNSAFFCLDRGKTAQSCIFHLLFIYLMMCIYYIVTSAFYHPGYHFILRCVLLKMMTHANSCVITPWIMFCFCYIVILFIILNVCAVWNAVNWSL